LWTKNDEVRKKIKICGFSTAALVSKFCQNIIRKIDKAGLQNMTIKLVNSKKLTQKSE